MTDLDDQEDRWEKRANCIGTDPALFFCDKGDPNMHEDTKQAIAVCLGCEVKVQCFQLCASDAERWRYGVWGGTTAGIRRMHFRRRLVLAGQFDPKVLDRPLAYVKDFPEYGELTA